ncbi:hypothetical protein F5Y06DRAFT_7470 [Hypoxylon sp. FL0890]|nr:hypothetical protein F5Y06DRAFT_7470 [Hypoxylon sp. FL0890]
MPRASIYFSLLETWGHLMNHLRRLWDSVQQFISRISSSEMSQSQPESRFGICASCKESKNVSDLIIAPCGHPYCRQCLRELFENAVSNEASFPARCCHQRIHLEPNIQYLEEDLVRQYRAKAVEYSSVQRIYCHQLRCSAFIPPEDRTNNDALCRACQSHTCTLCKGPAHTGACPRNYALERVLAVAQENGWRRCPGCQTLIEWNTGCYHMT